MGNGVHMVIKISYYILFIILSALVSCTTTEEKHSTNLRFVEISDQQIVKKAFLKNSFSCRNSNLKDSELPLTKYAELKLTANQIEITNQDNSLFDGVSIHLFIDNQLKINHINYNEWDDVKNDSFEIKYVVLESKVNLNKNPFSNFDGKLNGNYYLKIKKITDYKVFWKKDDVVLFSSKANFNCE